MLAYHLTSCLTKPIWALRPEITGYSGNLDGAASSEPVYMAEEKGGCIMKITSLSDIDRAHSEIKRQGQPILVQYILESLSHERTSYADMSMREMLLGRNLRQLLGKVTNDEIVRYASFLYVEHSHFCLDVLRGLDITGLRFWYDDRDMANGVTYEFGVL